MASELGAFLRARRTDAALQPGQAAVGQRRVSGLRREEVAAAAGISIDYYVRLEQGRERNPSDSVLAAIARVLRLNADAVQHLRTLRDGVPEPTVNTDSSETVARMQLLVDAVRPNPAYVLDRLSTIVAANAEGLALFDGIEELPPQRRSTLRYLLTDPRARTIFLDWEDVVRGAVGHLRAANADDLTEPQLQAFVAELSAESELFAGWWSGHVVHRRRSSTLRILTAEGAVVARRYEILHLPDDRMRMTIWLPPMA
ncbi:MAG: XRE family transcriptional regulator [Actinomycetota bacterium]|nr:MAG: XRE family transcriptional regulator [Actinomycetota bacterium]